MSDFAKPIGATTISPARRVFRAFLLIALGAWLGGSAFDSASIGSSGVSGTYGLSGGSNGRPLLDLIERIDQVYVDSVDRTELETVAVEAILEHLDPFSSWIPPSYFDEVNEQMQGVFQGIGVEFAIIEDTIRVLRVLPGGPSSSLDLQAGDRIYAVDDSVIASPDLNNDLVKQLLKGPAGTSVLLGLHRPSFAPGDNAERLEIEVTRGNVFIPSVSSGHMLAPGIAYIHVDRFADQTDIEFQLALARLQAEGAERLIIDLTSNSGGYLHAVIPMAELFLAEGQSVVYTEGKARPRQDYIASRDGLALDMPVAVAITVNSASASEIFAGALQDHDRALIVGRRSFGKGLVQEEYPVGGGALRLTVSRYYTPSGRCIQTPYGAAAPPRDSTSSALDPADPLVYFTDAGREVYGGGGIAPDLEVARDTSAGRRALAEALWLGWPGYHVEELIEANRHAYAQIEDEYAWAATWRSLDLGVDSLAADALAFHPDYSPALLEEFSEALGQFLARRIAHQLWGPGASYFIGAQYSPIIQRAVLALQSEEELDLSPAASDSLPSEQHNESQNELQN